MIPSLVGWTTETLPQGVALTHPGGRHIAVIHYRERARPLRRLGQLLAEILPRLPGWATDKIGEPERLLTFDGEHAALVTIAGRQDGEPAQRDLGVVFGDDFFSAVGGLCRPEALRPEVTRLVRELTRRDTHALGIRRRRFEYEVPPGWSPVALPGFAVQWLAPGFPRDRTTLKIFAALPHRVGEGLTMEDFVRSVEAAGHTIRARRVVQQLDVRGLAGAVEEIHPARKDELPAACRLAILRDERYLYALEMWSARELADDHPHWATFRDVLASIVPVPPPSASEAAAGIVSFWLD
jgi:hypothetical protein